ncbi:NADPH-dependent FMN reductase [Cellulomonas sp. URHD0024]|uniref:NADPH-dependent FMN reductase n=1 Tax=Cellulomonas sp. URHD0024 TaxID=1302620 RepID=UPI0003FB9009|nr:NAD(P)H-dependent oxidoreductase [Cellulomonas sp. URHD0024]
MVSKPAQPVVALVGNPRVGSRTLVAAQHVAGRLGAEVTSIDLATIGHQLFTADRSLLDPALSTVAQARLLVVATPVYKASYTGLLKSFLDLYGPDGLAGVVAVPLVISGNPAHALVGEVHLRPLLVELGATVPTRSLTVTEADLTNLDPAVDRWLDKASGPLHRALAHDLVGADR